MITVLHHPRDSYSPEIRVLLNVSLVDLEKIPAEAHVLFKEAKSPKREVGCILRQFGGDTFFTYEPANRFQLEMSLIAALAVPKTDIHVSQN
jgi:hypothetical protein